MKSLLIKTAGKCGVQNIRCGDPGIKYRAVRIRTSCPSSSLLICLHIFLIIPACLVVQDGNAQFIPYSQYYNTPVLTNPSQAGLSDFTQLTVHYRRSRVANYETPSVSFVRPFYRDRDGLRFAGVGANLISQKAGVGGIYRVMGALGTFAYNIHFSRKHHISAGLQGGVINKKLDPSGITTDNQFNFGAFDPTLPNGENFRYSSVTKPVINSGFTWTLTDSSNVQKAALGIAFSNMNRASYDFISDSNEEEITYTITGEMRVLQRGRTSIHPTFRYIGGLSAFGNLGAQIRHNLGRDKQEISIGGWYKTTNAVILAAQYNDKAYTLSASMDFSAASELQANVNNAFELSVGWRMKRRTPVKRTASSPLTEIPSSTTTTPEPAAMEEPEPAQLGEPVKVHANEPVRDTIITLVNETDEISPDESSILKTHIAFKLGSAELTPESVHFIKTELASVLRNHPDHILHVAGHSCTIGDKAINEEISTRRAEAVGEILVQQGITKNRIVISGMDFQKPVASNDTEEGRARNRRVEFELVKE